MQQQAADTAAWQQVQFSKHDQFLQNKAAKDMAAIFERHLRKQLLGKQQAVQVKPKNEEKPIVPQAQELDAPLLSASYFVRKTIPTSKPDQEPLAYVQLDPTLFQQTSTILQNTDAFLERESVLNNLQGKTLAPNINEIFAKKYGDYMVERKKQRETAGKGWFNMPELIVTPEIKQELLAMKLKHATKGVQGDILHDADASDDWEQNPPKFMQIGRVIEGPHEFYQRTPKRLRKQSFLDEIIQEANETGYIDERYKEIQKNLDPVQKRKKKRLNK